MAELDGNQSSINILGAETLTDGAFTDGTYWTGAGEFGNPPAGSADFTYSATGAGTMTQDNGDLISPADSVQYRFVHTNTAATPLNPSTALTITTAFADSAVTLDATAGTKYKYFTSDASASSADFVLDVTGASAGVITIDDASLKTANPLAFVSADYNDEKQISEVPPDVNTAGKDSVDPNLYQATLSLNGNQDLTTWYGSAVATIEAAYNSSGGSSNAVTIEIKPDSSDETYRDTGTFRVYSFKKGLKVGEIQQWSAELKSTGDITRDRPTS